MQVNGPWAIARFGLYARTLVDVIPLPYAPSVSPIRPRERTDVGHSHGAKYRDEAFRIHSLADQLGHDRTSKVEPKYLPARIAAARALCNGIRRSCRSPLLCRPNCGLSADHAVSVLYQNELSKRDHSDSTAGEPAGRTGRRDQSGPSQA